MNKQNRIFSGLFILLGLGVAIVWWWQRPGNSTSNQSAQTLEERSDVVERIGTETVQAFSESSTGLWVFATDPTPRFIQYSSETFEITTEWEQPEFVVVDEIHWSPAGTFVTIWTRRNTFEPQRVWLLDLQNQVRTELTTGIESVAWSPNEQHVYYIFRPPAGRTTTQLVRADNQFRNWTVLLDPLPIAQPEIAMNTTGNGLLIWENLHREEFDELDDNVLRIISLDTLAIRIISPAGIYAAAVPRSDDVAVASLAYDAAAQLIPKIQFVAQDGSTSAATDLVSFPDKFTWLPDQRLLVAAAMNEATLMPNKLGSTSDRLMILESGRKPRVVSGYNNIQPITALALSSNQQSVYLLQSGNLYRIPISLIR